MIEGLVSGEVVKLSRVGSPTLRRSLERDHPVIVVPAVRGLTVWDHDDRAGTAVVERPNRVGRLDHVPPRGPWSSFDTPVTEAAVLAAARLRKMVTQIRGVAAPPFPVEAPWFVVLLPIQPSSVAARLGDSEVLDLPEYPGGLLIDTRRHATESEARQYAAALETAIAEARGGLRR